MKKSVRQPVRFVVGQQVGLILVAVAGFLTYGGVGPIWLVVLVAIWQALLLWQYYVLYRTSSRA
ncbi:hypothetical protein ACLRGI_02000 [Paenarthrobacter nitroguajacolicus]|uniref:hypothetical protein n=1 Tax=Paenarthrobacter nitroguajacolicus TaxID=211146 RepID=UPI003AE125AD